MKVTSEKGTVLLQVPLPPDFIAPNFVWGLLECLKWMDAAEAEIGTPFDTADINSIEERMLSLVNHFASSTQVCSSATWYLKTAKKAAYDDVARRIKEKDLPTEFNGLISASTLRAYISDRCADLEALKVRADRLNASITHSIDALCTSISKAKTEMELSKVQRL